MTLDLELSGPALPPASGDRPKQLVVLLHGVGADGNDLIGLAPYWNQALPEAEFVAPHAPFPCDMAPFGYQWFSLLDRSPESLIKGLRTAAPLLNRFLDRLLADRQLPPSRLALVGFSQGTMMAMHVALRRARPVACVVGYSGALLETDLPADIKARPPMLLVHGEADEVVPVQALNAATATLERLGVTVQGAIRPELGHSIDLEGMRLGSGFIAERFRSPKESEASSEEGGTAPVKLR